MMFFRRHKPDRLGERFEFKFSNLQAFKVPKGCDKLQLSIVSDEPGKAIAKFVKATVHSGTCQWKETPSEFILIPRNDVSKELEECLFKIVVYLGSHRSVALGEVVLNLTEYISSQNSGLLQLPLQKCNHGTLLQVRIQCLNPKSRFRDEKPSKEMSSHPEGIHSKSNDVDSKSDIYDGMLNQSVGSSSSHLGTTCANEPVNQDASFLASEPHLSSESGDGSIGKSNFSPINVSNGAGAELARSNPSSFNSRASDSSTPNRCKESVARTSLHGLSPISLRPSISPKDFIEAAEETMEELQDEAKMWERHAQKLKIDIQKLKKELFDKSEHQAELDTELSAAYFERDSLKQEVEQLKSSLEENMTKQTASETAKFEDMLQVQKELEYEVQCQKESIADLSCQLKKAQEANLEFTSIIGEQEGTIKKLRLQMTNNLEKNPLSDTEGHMRSPVLSSIEEEWASKLSAKEEEIIKLEDKVAGMLIAQQPKEVVSDQGHHDLIKEIEGLRSKVQELESDCAELTDENLELLYKIKVAKKDTTEAREYADSGSEIGLLRSQICDLEDELRRKEMLQEGLLERLTSQIKDLEKKCADFELEQLYFKDQACDLSAKLTKSKADIEEKTLEVTKLQQEFENFKVTELEELKALFSLKEKEVEVLNHTKEELEDLVIDIRREKCQLEENLASVIMESNKTSKCFEDAQRELMLLARTVDTHVSTNKILERKLMELESCKHELETHISEVEEENIQLTECISGLEAHLSCLTNEEESNRLELEESKSLVTYLENELAKHRVEMEIQEGVLKQKLQEAQEENIQLTERISGLEAQLSCLTNEKESNRLELEESKSLVTDLENELAKHQVEMEIQEGVLKQKLQEAQERNIQLTERISGLEAQLSCLTNEKESNRLELEQSESLVTDLENEVAKHKAEMEIQKGVLKQKLQEAQEENTQLTDRISGLEAQLSCLTSEKESNKLELEQSKSLVTDLENEVAKHQAEMEIQKGELKQKLQEAQEEIKYLKSSLSNLQSARESLIEENISLQKLNGDLQRQKLEMYGCSASLEVKLSESQKMMSEFLMEVDGLEQKISLLQKDNVSKERSLASQIESMFQEHKEQEEKINIARLMLNQIDLEKTVEVENLRREMEAITLQVSATQDERERMASDARQEVSSLRSDKIRLESSLREAHDKVQLLETDLQTLRQETDKKVQGLAYLLNASKQREEILISGKEHMKRQIVVAKCSEEKCKRTVSELELKLKAADYGKQQLIEETSSMKVQLQKLTHLEDEILALKSSLEDAKCERAKLEQSLQLVSAECKYLKTERVLLEEKILSMQKALQDSEDDRHNKIALEEKVLRLEGDLIAKEASFAREAALKKEVNRTKLANNEFQRKIQHLEEENDKIVGKAQVLEKELILLQEEIQDKKFSKKVDSRLHDREAEIQELQARIHILEREHAEAQERNNMYMTQLEGSLSGKRSGQSEALKKCVSENDMTLHQVTKVASLEAELKDMKERYLSMSLQYAEVEAERGELVMKLKSMPQGKRWFS